MPSQKQIKNQSKQVKRLMKEQQYFYIKNNEKFRKQLEMNQTQLTHTLKYLNKTGFLKPWNRKIYQIMHN
jgi:ABC-type Zn2+ transport system substrate-binding protein/surface adhesin